ncbi:tonB dependent receptor family protein [Lysobacter capsici]|uniref:TonB-dependent receptor n=1 Tax=Lysobacter capsici TaxID=435897 RepID=UPI000716515C|nr:TonB-dependent receptor [Lysobacter capsici]ALN84316.1 tonB dependent receptor family protein [Lysobacter capsici]
MSLRKHRLVTATATAIAALCGGGLVLAAPAAFAQSAEPNQASAPKELDKITVTAQSREQELQDVPIALQVVTDQLIDDTAAQDLGDLDSFVPGLVVDSQQPTQPGFELRGISTDDFGIGTDPAVGVYVDGVYAGRGGGVLLPFTDVERIEVLKGPQGTLFGRNTAAGAISIITRKPDASATEVKTKLRIGNYGKQYLEGMLNLPTGEDSAFRFNALVNHADGWIQDAATGRDLNPENNWATRAAFKTRFGERTSALISWDHESLDQLGQATTGIIALPPAPGLAPLPVDESAYLDPRKVPTMSDAEGNEESRRFDGVTLIVDHGFDWGGFTSTTSWRDYDSVNRVEEDGTNRNYLYVDSTNTESNRSYYQEFKFSGSTDKLDWIAGASYFKEDARQTSEVNALTDSVDTIVHNLGLAPTPNGYLFGYVDQQLDALGIPIHLLGHRWNETFRNTLDTKAYAVFGDVIWHATDKLNLTVGLRYTRDEKDFSWHNDPRYAPGLDAALDQLEGLGFFDLAGIPRDFFVFDIAFIDPPAMLNKGLTNRDKRSWSDFSPRFVADYHINDDTMVFASLAKGYKAGGFNSLQIGSSFENEDVWNFETGIKKSFPDQRLQLNASAFYYVYDNRQAVRLDSSTSIPRFVVDTSDLEAYGLDFDMRWQATDNFGLDFNASFIDSTYKNYVTSDGIDASGDPTGLPYWSAAGGAYYVVNLADHGDLRFSLRHSYRGKVRCSAESQAQNRCGVSPALDLGEAQNRTDLRIGWTSPQGRWGLAAYGNNLFDNQYINSLGTYGKNVLGTVGARVSEPRTFGVEFSAKY